VPAALDSRLWPDTMVEPWARRARPML
jgi:hypothetical protein